MAEQPAARGDALDFSINLRREALVHEGREIRLRPKSFQTLRYLHERHGRLVTKDELLSAVWPDTFVSDDSLTQCIREIRHALGDSNRQRLKTVPRRGFILERPFQLARDEAEGSIPPLHRSSRAFGCGKSFGQLAFASPSGFARWSAKAKVLPFPSALATLMLPPSASTKCFTIDSPSPVPPTSRERPASMR